MTVNEWISIIFEAILLCALIVGTVFGNLHFKNKKADHYREIAVHAAEEWVAYMDKQDLNNDEKFNQALDGVIKELQSHGFNIGQQKTTDLKTLIEWAVTQLRIAQAKAGVHNTVKPSPDIAKNVDPKNVVQPTQAGGANA